VVFAFEQSLVNMTQRLQRLAATTDQKVSTLHREYWYLRSDLYWTVAVQSNHLLEMGIYLLEILSTKDQHRR